MKKALVVHKYVLNNVAYGEPSKLDLPAGARFLRVAAQSHSPVLWFLVDPTAPVVARAFWVVATGQPLDREGTYCGTIFLADFSFHVFMDRPAVADAPVDDCEEVDTFLEAMHDLTQAAYRLNEAWMALDGVMDTSAFSEKYPFKCSFDELVPEISEWEAETKRAIAKRGDAS